MTIAFVAALGFVELAGSDLFELEFAGQNTSQLETTIIKDLKICSEKTAVKKVKKKKDAPGFYLHLSN